MESSTAISVSGQRFYFFDFSFSRTSALLIDSEQVANSILRMYSRNFSISSFEALQEKARARRRALGAKVVGVTGSAGKTTTKELLKAFLSTVGRTYATEGNFNNHIGLPLTILNCPDDAEFLVLEMGSNHPGEIAALCDIAAPDAGVVTSVGAAHLEFFGSLDGVAQEKGALLASAREFGAELLGRLRELKKELDNGGA